jgi:hypothetical protein
MKRCFLVCLTVMACVGQSALAAPVRSLDEFGDISSVALAQETLNAAVDHLIASGGGLLVIPEGAPEGMEVENLKQAERLTSDESPVVTILDIRKGYAVFHVAPIGKHQSCIWSGMTIDRKLNLGQQSLPHCGVHSAQAIHNYNISGSSSYMATLTEPATKGKDSRCYVDLIRGIWVGANLNITSSAMGYAAPYDRITVKSIGWDPDKRAHYFTADLEYDHPAAALVYNKHVTNALQINGYSNCDNQTAGELSVIRNHYAVGDNFVITGMMKYMGDIFSGFGDEGGVVLNAETVGEIDGFHTKVEAVDWSKDEITYEPGTVNPHTLSNSRPLVNMNEAKWLTAGTVMVVSPGGTYKGQSYPGVIGGPKNVFNYQGGAIIGSADCPWDESVVGRFFCLTEPTETILPGDRSSVGGYASAAGRPIYRWYEIKGFERNPDGTKRIRILRVRWSAVAAGAPTLFLDDNYTSDGHERPMKYAIAPGAWVYDISQGYADTFVTGGWVGKDHPRRIRVTPSGDRGTSLDFEVGDPIEQACGPDPWQPRPLRIRQFDQMPSTMPSSSIEVEQYGRVQVPYGMHFSSLTSSREDLANRKDGKPGFGTVVGIDSMSNVAIDLGGEVTDSAILFRQPNGRPQPIRWRQDVVGSSSLAVEPSTGDFVLAGGNVDVSGKGLKQVTGVSATTQAAHNLRGINAAVAAGGAELQVSFATPEADAEYAVSVTPSWMTNLCVSAKTAQGFTVQFGTPAPEGAKVDWVLLR